MNPEPVTNAVAKSASTVAAESQLTDTRNITIISDAWFPQINGVVRVLSSVRRELEAMGHRVEIIAPNRFRTLPCPGYPEIPLSILPKRVMSELLDTGRTDAIHIATEGPLGISARTWCRRNNVPFTSAYHTKFPEYIHARTRIPLNLLYLGMRRFHAPSTSVLAPSASVYHELSARGFRNVHKWSHGVDTDVFRPRGKDYVDLPRPILMFIGRLAIEKNVRAFLEMDFPGSKVVVGDGPQRKELMRAFPAAEFRIAKGDEELSRYFSAADVFVFPSRTDTFGLTMLEALSCGVPVAAFPVTGPLDVLGMEAAGETEAGCLDENLVTAVERALSKSPEACRRFAAQFSWRRVADEFLEQLALFDANR